METAEIIDTDLMARGIAKADGKAVFIPGAVTGDRVLYETVRQNRRYDIGELREVIKPSPHRIVPDCPMFGSCGGCSFSNISRSLELQIKKNAVQSALRRAGLGSVPVSAILSGKCERYRNKAVLHLSDDGSYGFISADKSTVLPIGDCHLIPKEFSDISACISDISKSLAVSPPPSLMLRIGDDGEIMLVYEDDGASRVKLTDRLLSQFGNIVSVYSCKGYPTSSDAKYSFICGKKTISQTIDKISFNISPSSFFQVNTEIFGKVCDVICDFLDPPDNAHILDLYCGSGVIGMVAAKRNPSADLIGIEINPDAVADAKNTAFAAHINNIDFIAGNAGSISSESIGTSPYALIVDPPRFGLTQTMIGSIFKLSPKKIVYMSCNPSTLAGDISKLVQNEYSLSNIVAADMFPRTSHVETVCLLTRKRRNYES